MHQYRLCLVVGIVGYGNRLRASRLRHASQKTIAGTAGRLLDRQPVLTGQSWYISPSDRAAKIPIIGQCLDKISISIGFSPTKAVMQMGNVKMQVIFCPDAAEYV